MVILLNQAQSSEGRTVEGEACAQTARACLGKGGGGGGRETVGAVRHLAGRHSIFKLQLTFAITSDLPGPDNFIISPPGACNIAGKVSED